MSFRWQFELIDICRWLFLFVLWLHNFIVIDFVLSFAEHRHLGTHIVLIDIVIFTAGNVELLMLVRQDGHLVRIVPLHYYPVLEVRWNAVLNVVLELFVAIVELFLVASLIADLDR